MESLSPAMRLALGHRKSKKRRSFERRQQNSCFEIMPDGSLLIPRMVSVLCQRDARERRHQKGSSDALVVVFDFYSKLQTPAHQLAQRGVTYEEIQNCNERLSLFELLQWCRDFGLVPSLVSKQDLDIVWRLCMAEHHRSRGPTHYKHTDHSKGQVRDCGLVFDEFLSAIVRIALVAFATDVVTDGDGRGAIRRMASFLRLADGAHARETIRTVGRETQRRLYFRSHGEANRRASEALLEEKRGALAKAKLRRETRAMSSAVCIHSCENDPEKRRLNQAVDLFSKIQANAMTPAEQTALSSYDPILVDELKPYCGGRRSKDREWIPFESLGLDFGRLPCPGTFHSRIDVINVSSSSIVLQNCRPQSHVISSVTFDPRPFAPGLSRHIDITVKTDALRFDDLEDSGTIDFDVCTVVPGTDSGPTSTYPLPLYVSSYTSN